MQLLSLYKGLCDETRLRILHLLTVSPLCVCHIQAVLRKSQVVTSQHLAYLRERGLVVGRRYRSWMIYSLPQDRPEALEANLKCLQNAVPAEPMLQKDLQRLKGVMGSSTVTALLDEGCCARLSGPAKAVPRKKQRLGKPKI